MLSVAPFLNGDEAFFLAGFTDLINSLGDISQVIFHWQLDVLFLGTSLSDEGKEAVLLDVLAHILSLGDDGLVDSVRGGVAIGVVLASEYVSSNEVALARAVFTGLMLRIKGDFTWVVLQHYKGGVDSITFIGLNILSDRRISVALFEIKVGVRCHFSYCRV